VPTVHSGRLSMMTADTPTDRDLPLRERKKLRTRRALSEAALRMFIRNGFDATTLDELVDAVEVSKRTFYANYASKEDVALAAESELWDAYVLRVAVLDPHGPLLDALRAALSATITGLGDDWTRRFIATRGLIARTPALGDRSTLLSFTVQGRIVEQLEDKLGVDSRADVRLRLLGELLLSAWRCGARNWVAGRGDDDAARHGTGGVTTLVHRVDEAFDAIPASITLSAP